MQVNEKGNLHAESERILQLTAESYECPKGEEHLYHCRIEQKHFNAQTGERISTPRVQKFNAKMFESNLLHNLHQLGYSVDILYNPTAWLKEDKVRRQKEEERRAKAKAGITEEEMQERINAAVAQALAATKKKGGKK